MIIKKEMDLRDFQAWSGAVDTLNKLIELDLVEQAQELIEELNSEGLTDTELNDILWFEDEWLFEALGVNNDEDEED